MWQRILWRNICTLKFDTHDNFDLRYPLTISEDVLVHYKHWFRVHFTSDQFTLIYGSLMLRGGGGWCSGHLH